MLNRYGNGTKLIGGFAVVAIICAVLAGVGVHELNGINREYAETTATVQTQLTLVAEIAADTQRGRSTSVTSLRRNRRMS